MVWLELDNSQLNQFLSENRFVVPISTMEMINYETIYFTENEKQGWHFFREPQTHRPFEENRNLWLTYSGQLFRELFSLFFENAFFFFVESWSAHVRRCSRSDGSHANSYRKSYHAYVRTLWQLGSRKVEPSSLKIPTLPSKPSVSS